MRPLVQQARIEKKYIYPARAVRAFVLTFVNHGSFHSLIENFVEQKVENL